MTIDYEDWYKNSKYNLPYDIHLCAYSALLRVVSKWHDEIFSDPSKPTGLNKMVDFHSVTMKYDEKLTIYHDEWTKRFAESSDPNGPASHAGSAFRCRLLTLYAAPHTSLSRLHKRTNTNFSLVAYSRLAIFSFGFQKAYQRGIQPADHVYTTKCLDSAKAVIQNMIDNLAPTGYMRYAPNGHFIFAAFASAFLLKVCHHFFFEWGEGLRNSAQLLRPEFASLLSKDQENAIFELISRLINTLSSDKIAVDERHTPNLYARFLTKLLSERRGDGSTVGRLHLQPPSHEPSSEDVSQHVTAIYTTNNTGFSFVTPNTEYPQNHELQYNSQPFHQPREIRDTTPIYEGRLDPTTTGVTQFTKDSGFSWLDSGSFLGEEMLAAMKMVENPDWLENVLMPGCVLSTAAPLSTWKY
ncbi:hypothetical protein H0H81_004446 [Sphagnurus paluster]|uniref:Uncharacterized protein n=1 Tax=Sphagnurus paluster TaxID=117069 RepID=A0A9P7FUG9_9AGAR|nr:hypothetical protein H0H81_004446 [Sphagnurus paluster]